MKTRRLVKVRIQSYFDWATVIEIFGRREYDTFKFARNSEVKAYFDKLSATGSALILDLGANIGVAASFFAESFPGANIVAVEPSSKNLYLLGVNTMKKPGVNIVHGAVGPSTGKVNLYDNGSGNNAFRTFGEELQKTETVDCFSIGELIAANPDSTPFLVKIDIEGAEKDLFAQENGWIDRFKVIVVETHDWMLPGQAVSSNLLAALGGRNRDLIFQGENLFSIRID
jgi:FkbM family methyltransferase